MLIVIIYVRWYIGWDACVFDFGVVGIKVVNMFFRGDLYLILMYDDFNIEGSWFYEIRVKLNIDKYYVGIFRRIVLFEWKYVSLDNNLRIYI